MRFLCLQLSNWHVRQRTQYRNLLEDYLSSVEKDISNRGVAELRSPSPNFFGRDFFKYLLAEKKSKKGQADQDPNKTVFQSRYLTMIFIGLNQLTDLLFQLCEGLSKFSVRKT